jgi:hypothetical protein
MLFAKFNYNYEVEVIEVRGPSRGKGKGEKMKAYTLLVAKPEGKRPLGGPRFGDTIILI